MQNSTNAPLRTRGISTIPVLRTPISPEGYLVYIDPDRKSWRLPADVVIIPNTHSIGSAPHTPPRLGDKWKDVTDDRWYTYVNNGGDTGVWLSD